MVGTGATSQQQEPQESNKARVVVSHKQKECKQAKPYINLKRKNTWSWQDQIYVPRTRTSYNERTTHGCAYLRWMGKLWQVRAEETFRRYVDLKDPDEAICHFFGSYCDEAIVVATCESGDRDGDLSLEALNAHNGQYLGMFQMGDFARSTYGHGNTAIEQARAASLYFFASGRDWSPWGCQPY